ncbi:MAG: hypothetical protein NVV73_05145 [Cellvibrionaceae bacterium]|nr:hypothetical protein [Cellvibrionaceae bacterium]
MTIRALLSERARQALQAAGAPADCDPNVAPSKNASFGDYQINGAMGAAKKVGSNPRELAQKIVANLQLDNIAEKIEIAGPGFINITLNPTWLAQQLLERPPTPV